MNWILLALIALAVVAGAGETSGLIKLPVPPALFFAVAGVLAIVFFLRLLPLRARRVAIFALTFVALAGLSGGLYYFQFFIKPQMVKGFIAAAFTPKPTAVTAEKVVKETWALAASAGVGDCLAFVVGEGDAPAGSGVAGCRRNDGAGLFVVQQAPGSGLSGRGGPAE